MKPLSLALLTLALLLLSGCSMLERSYTSVVPHTQFSDEAENDAILRADTYQGLVSAILHLVEQGEERGIIRLYQYISLTGSAASDVDSACLEVTQEDPLGTYAVDYIKYDVSQTSAYYQVSVSIAYNKNPQLLSQVISVTGSTAVERELITLLPSKPTQVLFRISYFTKNDSTESLRQAVLDAYAQQVRALPPLKSVQVNLYPDQGQERLAEILLTWGTPKQG
ncbi:MAG: hypothetical protein SOR61_03605 [Evtepia sp.]|uniref:hypothetical protein n=1 Tax=Evtepia sp. TaxID=2773933 RepID=UPI002A75196E|nr:hypothetical protein [Evtepia sp.]MDY3014270.1 hypothetical protein [Evtepia sp.]